MLLLKEGFPEESELLLCTVTKVNPGSVFVVLDEYKKSGLIHISEISPGRIRNIRDFVKEGKKVVCKVLKIDSSKGHIDLSLRRVSDGQRRKKVDEIKQQQKSEKIVEFVADKNKKDAKVLFKALSEKVLEDYDSLYDFFIDIVNSNTKVIDYFADKKIAGEIEDIVKQRIKPQKVEVEGTFKITSYDPDGVCLIKDAFKKTKNVEVKYVGGGLYHCIITSSDYKTAEKLLQDDVSAVLDFIDKKGGTAEFVKKEK